jgi:hypothetical protein
MTGAPTAHCFYIRSEEPRGLRCLVTRYAMGAIRYLRPEGITRVGKRRVRRRAEYLISASRERGFILFSIVVNGMADGVIFVVVVRLLRRTKPVLRDSTAICLSRTLRCRSLTVTVRKQAKYARWAGAKAIIIIRTRDRPHRLFHRSSPPLGCHRDRQNGSQRSDRQLSQHRRLACNPGDSSVVPGRRPARQSPPATCLAHRVPRRDRAGSGTSAPRG